MVENSTSPITAMNTQPPTKFLSLNSANWMNGPVGRQRMRQEVIEADGRR